MLFDFIIGDIVQVETDYIVVENNNLGYRIKANGEKFKLLLNKDSVKVYTEVVLRQDDISIYGFLSKDERTIYNMLTLVTGIGPRAAMAILNTLSAHEIRQAILLGNAKEFIRAPGVGKKSSERIILELKDRISKEVFEDDINLDGIISPQLTDEIEDQALEALITLGYNRYEVENILRKVSTDLTVEQRIKEALRLLAK